MSSALNFATEKKIKALAVTTKERMKELPDVPSLYELGWKDAVTTSWQGVLVPANTPRPIVDKLHGALVKVLSDPEVVAKMRKGGAVAVSSKTPEEFKSYIDVETAKWTKVIVDSGARPD
jgi:tripartite-type tricarboxylate transporter receptor subunit TctC